MKLLIQQGRLVDPVSGIGGIMDVLIENGKIVVLGSDIRVRKPRSWMPGA